MQCENYQNNNQYCIKKILQYPTQFLLVGQLAMNVAQYSINLTEKRIVIFLSFTIRYGRVSITAENIVLQLIDLFPFLGFVNRAVCGQHKHTGQTT
jgi:hypothetical protein